MKLSDLLADLGHEELERLVHEHARAEEQMSRSQQLETIAGVLRSYRFMQEFLLNRQPPTFAILTLLLDERDHALPSDTFRSLVLAETERLCRAIDAREILKREDQLRVYRRVLYQARSNDELIDSSESELLAVLRQELGLTQTEHFLLEHHADLREFWQVEGAFARELHALRSAGLVYARDGRTLIPDDLVPIVRQVFGIAMARSSARRLFDLLSNNELHEGLALIEAPTSGSKSERIERLIAHMAQPRTILQSRIVSLERLRDTCRQIGTNVTGSKEELADRIVHHMAHDRDLLGEPEPPPIVQEPRGLEEPAFRALFGFFKGYQLGAMLAEFELRRWGTKQAQVQALWDAHRAAHTLLSSLNSPDLELALKRLGLRTPGSKTDRIQRLVEHFAAATPEDLEAVQSTRGQPTEDFS